MLSNQQLYLVNHFVLVARRRGIHLPELKLLLDDAALLRRHVEQVLAPGADPAVAEAAGKVAASMNWSLASASAQADPGMTPDEFVRAKKALLAVAGPIAGFIVEQIDTATVPMSLSRFLDEAAALAQLDEAHRRTLRKSCGLSAD